MDFAGVTELTPETGEQSGGKQKPPLPVLTGGRRRTIIYGKYKSELDRLKAFEICPQNKISN